MDNKTYRTKSGEVNGNRLAGLFYTLMRDHIPVGKLEDLVMEVEGCDVAQFTNGHLGNIANDMVDRLLAPEPKMIPSKPTDYRIHFDRVDGMIKPMDDSKDIVESIVRMGPELYEIVFKEDIKTKGIELTGARLLDDVTGVELVERNDKLRSIRIKTDGCFYLDLYARIQSHYITIN